MFSVILDNQDLSFSLLNFFNIEEELLEIEIEVFYKIFGSNKPATFYDPAEYAEIDDIKYLFKELTIDGKVIVLNRFQLNRVDEELKELFQSDKWKDSIEAKCWEHADSFAKQMNDLY